MAELSLPGLQWLTFCPKAVLNYDTLSYGVKWMRDEFVLGELGPETSKMGRGALITLFHVIPLNLF